MQDEFKTTVISFDKSADKVEKPVAVTKTVKVNVNDQADDNVIKNVLFNVTTKVPHVTTSIPAVDVEIKAPSVTKKLKSNYKKLENINKNYKFIPKFYLQEFRRYKRLLFIWIFIAIAALALSCWGLVAILTNSHVNNWVSLTLVPGLGLAFAFLIVYANNFVNFRSEARNIDFSKEKVVSTNVVKLYKRLKTGYININWFCLLAYVGSLLVILINYLVAWGRTGCKSWGDLSYATFQSNVHFIILVVSIIVLFVAFFMHIFLLVNNYVRASKIDNFYNIQIVSDEELQAIKSKKNKRNAIIFIGVILCIALIGILIYKVVTSKKQTNNVTINN